MSVITKQDTNGVKTLLQVGELGYDNYPAGGDAGRVWVGTGSENLAIAKKVEVEVVETSVIDHINDTGNPHGVTKAQVGLGSVDNTSDIDKPVSTATQDALDLKANAEDAVLTGIPVAPTAAVGTNTTQLATTEYVKAELVSETYSKAQLDAGQLDNRYYTETELLNGALDSRYYTESELDAGQLDSRYYTQTQVDTMLEAQNDASEINVTPSGNLVSTNVQDALVELQLDVDDRYTKSEADVLLAGKVDDSEIASVNLLRADKYLAAQNIANMIYTNGDLTKIRYKVDSDTDYETLSYTNGNLATIEHYISTVLKGTTTLSYGAGNLVSAVFVEA